MPDTALSPRTTVMNKTENASTNSISIGRWGRWSREERKAKQIYIVFPYQDLNQQPQLNGTHQRTLHQLIHPPAYCPTRLTLRAWYHRAQGEH